MNEPEDFDAWLRNLHRRQRQAEIAQGLVLVAIAAVILALAVCFVGGLP